MPDPNQIQISPDVQQQLNAIQNSQSTPPNTPGGIYNAQLKTQDPWYMHVIKSMMSDPGLSPMGLGVVAGSPGGNALVKQLIDQIVSEKLSPNEAAARFVSMKYPGLMSKVPGGVISSSLPEGNLGNMIPEDIAPLSKRSIQFDPMQHRNPGDVAETVGHELTHGGIQMERSPQMLEQYKQPPSSISTKDPIPPNVQKQWEDYWNQPAEVNARKGGKTVKTTLMQFLVTYPELKGYFGFK